MSYIDAIHSRDEDKIYVVERDPQGVRRYNEFPANYVFYYSDPKGKFRTIYDTPVSKFSTRNSKEFHKELRAHSHLKTWESDVNPIFRCLEENYRHQIGRAHV